MKNYVAPSIELNRFDAEDIIRTSGGHINTLNNLSDSTKSVVAGYNASVADADKIADTATAVEYTW